MSNIIFESSILWESVGVAIDHKKVLRIHGYKDFLKVRPRILNAAIDAVKEVLLYSTPKVFYTRTRIIDNKQGLVELFSGVELYCPIFSERLINCDSLIILFLTLGEKVDEEILRLQGCEDRPLGSIFLETAARINVEVISREFQKFLVEKLSREGKRLTMRMGPGYQYKMGKSNDKISWDLMQQFALFDAFGQKKPNLLLLDSGAMLPKMSRSAIFGVLSNKY